MSISRLASFLAATAIVLGAARASAQTGTGGAGGAGSFSASDFSIFVQNPPGTNIADVDLTTPAAGFNLARCQCQSPFTIHVVLSDTGRAKVGSITSSMFVKIAVGSLCDASPSYINNSQCRQVGNASYSMTGLATNGVDVPTNATEFITLGNDTSACATKNSTGNVTIFVLLFSSASGTAPDVSSTRNILIDVQPPELPAQGPPQPGQEAVVVNWTGLDQTVVNDLLGYQVFCIRGGEFQVFRNTGGALSAFGNLNYVSPGSLNAGICPGTPRNPDSPVTRDDIVNLNPAIACSGNISIGSTSFRIKGLENQIPYEVVVAAVDKFGNASPIVDQFQQQTPVSTRDFWLGYRQTPGAEATGGFCSLGRGAGPGGAAAALVAGLMVALAARRRRRR